MSSLVVAIGLISLFVIGFIVYFVNQGDAKLVTGETPADSSQSANAKVSLLMPISFVLFAPLVYFLWPTIDQQQSWLDVTNKTAQMKQTGDPSGLDMSIQEMLLGIRTLAHENPQRGDLWFELGGAYYRLQMEEAAIASWERAIRIDENPDYLVSLAQIFGVKQEAASRQKAINLLVRALRVAPEHQGGLLTLGFTYFNNQQYTAAIEIWQRLKSLPSVPESSKRFVDEQIAMAQARLNQQKTP